MADYSRLPGPGNDLWRWQDAAACRGLRTQMFYHPAQERGPAWRRREAEAKAICHHCPVIMQCREHALNMHEPYGIWGGLSAEKRKDQLRAGRKAQPVPLPTVPGRRSAG